MLSQPWVLEEDKLRAVNRCRNFLNILTTSDILTGDGLYIRHSVWEGKRDPHYGRDEDWPNQGIPPKRIGTPGEQYSNSLLTSSLDKGRSGLISGWGMAPQDFNGSGFMMISMTGFFEGVGTFSRYTVLNDRDDGPERSTTPCRMLREMPSHTSTRAQWISYHLLPSLS